LDLFLLELLSLHFGLQETDFFLRLVEVFSVGQVLLEVFEIVLQLVLVVQSGLQVGLDERWLPRWWFAC